MKKILAMFLMLIGSIGIGVGCKPQSVNIEFYGESDIVALLTGAGKYNQNESVVLIAEDKVGYDFAGWLKDGQIVSTDPTYTFVATDATSGKYTAQYAGTEHSITLVQNGGWVECPTTAKTGETVTIRMDVISACNYYDIVVSGEGFEISERVSTDSYEFVMPAGNVTVTTTFTNREPV